MDALSNIRLKRRTLLKGFGVVGLSSLAPTFLTLRQANGAPLLPDVPLDLRDGVFALQPDGVRLERPVNEN